jgi:DNA modification methylase
MSTSNDLPQTAPTNAPSPLDALVVEVPISDIVVGDRIRRDFSHVAELAESIKDVGLIQPIILTHNYHLIAGESRLRAHKLLGLTSIRAVFRGVLDEAQLTILEATENNVRKDFSWQERCLSVDKVHRLRSTNAALSGESWGVRETGRLLNQSKSNIGLATLLAEYLHANDEEVWKAESAADAYRVLINRKLNEANKLVAASTIPGGGQGTSAVRFVPPAPVVAPTIPDDDFFTAGPTSSMFTSGVSAPDADDEVPGTPTPGLIVPLSQMLLHGDSISILSDPSAVGAFDHCITDWPYGIDMDYLNANHVHGGMKNLDSVKAEHTVEGNMKLHAAIIPLIFRSLRPGGFFITWTDYMQWQRGYDLAIAAGFAVQRWPLVWHKTSSCMNQTAQYNFTKNHELAMVCRKPSATLVKPQSSSVWTGGNDIEAKALGHPFAKPFGLWNWIYDAVTVRGQHILEPFAGRGSAVIPAIRRGLKVTAIESNSDHHSALVVNISNVYRSLDPAVKFS